MTKSNAVTYIIKRYIEGKWRFIPGNGKSLGNYVYLVRWPRKIGQLFKVYSTD